MYSSQREAISMITKYVILLGLFALFATIHSLLRDIQEWNKQNKHLSRATNVFDWFKNYVAFIIVLEMLATDFSKIRDICSRNCF